MEKSTRQTKYCHSIKQELEKVGHATNAELLVHLRDEFPNLSATTVHRASARLASRGEIAVAPSNKSGSIRYDRNTKPHDHFQCVACESLIDTNIRDKILPAIEESISGCSISGQLTINGTCKNCVNKENSNENNNL